MVNDKDMQLVSWSELVIGLIILGILWYAYIILKYYRKDFANFSRSRKASGAPVRWGRETDQNNSNRATETSTTRNNDTHAQVHELMQELKLIFTAATNDKLSKEQTLEPIAIWLPKYRTLSDEIKASVAQHIVNEFSLRLKMAVAIEEINAL